MKKVFVLNAFSLQMLDLRFHSVLEIQPMDSNDVRFILLNNDFESAVGHNDTAEVFTNQLHILIPENRINVKLNPGDMAIVGQLTGGRLPEGTTTLPDGFNIQWVRVNVS